MVRERSLLLYYITDRSALADNESERRSRLLEKIAQAARAGVDYIQLRENDLSDCDLESLALAALNVIAKNSLAAAGRQQPTYLSINSRVDIALACSANGVHLRSNDISPRIAREIYERAAYHARPTISVSCHTVDEVSHAASHGADLALFAPVFGKPAQNNAPAAPPAGLDALRNACRQKIPVIALGGITLQNARECINAGAAGIAAIRLFQENDIEEIVRELRAF